ncbi:hypothetical protein SLNWT_7003 [Streptomyces albus]|uniref:Uncharacterized protein n=1 Tax=Streptomyces albus (strain ATCC 21838 / DSM 41398 / FERM P-419 / JCM 4703 / NBRC 107858) TaxID=1081613 RepID=A0A0B5EZY3_STRA4|nr:hypothetical protein SLNWT_7003 [Streptomyces albus]AOU81682.1 hypothetical protein SLNHY_6991 [Streptomyces albus]
MEAGRGTGTAPCRGAVRMLGVRWVSRPSFGEVGRRRAVPRVGRPSRATSGTGLSTACPAALP